MNVVSIKTINKEIIDKFDCGVEELNIYFKKYASQNDKNNLGKTFVVYENNKVIAFYTLANAQINFNDLPEEIKNHLPKYPIPCIRIARLAVDANFQKKGYGSKLLKNALIKIYELSQYTGLYFVVVDAKDTSKEFYELYGFTKLKDNTYVLSIKTLERIIN